MEPEALGVVVRGAGSAVRVAARRLDGPDAEPAAPRTPTRRTDRWPALPTLAVSAWERIGVPLDGALSGLARDAATGRDLAVTDRFGVYLLDSTLARVLHHVVIDPGFSVDLLALAGAAFLGGDTLAVVGTNKSWALLRPDPQRRCAAPSGATSSSTDGQVTEVGLGRFATVRAHQMYARSLAFDPAAQELITVSVPNPRHRQLVVSRFARADMVLLGVRAAARARGWRRRAGPDAGGLPGHRGRGGRRRLYAVSAAYSTLLVIDLRTKTVRAAYAVPGLAHPVGLAVRGSQLLVAQADGRIAVLERPAP